jgi:hypothetical protein
MMRHMQKNSGALFGRSVISAIAETMTAIMDVSWVMFVESTSSLWAFLVNRNPPKDIFLTRRLEHRGSIAKKI